MKRVLPIIFLTFPLILDAQKTFLDDYKASIVDSSRAKFIEVIDYASNKKAFKETTYFITGEKESEFEFVNSTDKEGIPYLWYLGAPTKKFKLDGIYRSWYKNGQLKSQSTYNNGEQNGKKSTWYENGKLATESDIVNGLNEGKSNEWYENGQLKNESNYMNGQYSGTITTYWRSGQIKRKEQYLQDKFQNGTCYDSLGNEIKHFELEEMPQYKGGDNQMFKDIMNNLQYPTNSRDAGIQGRVIVKFAVDKNGNISDLEVMAGINDELNYEAVRVIGTLKKFKPGLYDGEFVKVYYRVPISFTLK